jgi:hypothetical protein
MKNKLFIFLCFVSFSVCAQNGIGVQEVQVTESYKPQVPIVSKIMDLPLFEDSSKKEIKMSYLLNSKQYQTTYLIDTISAAKIKGEPLQKIYPSYIKLGIGTDALPNLDVFYNSSRDKTLNYGARLGFLQSYLRAKSVYDNQKVDANSKHTNVHLYGKKVLDF